MLIASAHTLILFVLIPVFTFVIIVLGFIVSLYPLLKDRMAKQHTKEDRDERLDAAADYVIGRSEDRERGRLGIEGLVSQVPELEKRVQALEEGKRDDKSKP